MIESRKEGTTLTGVEIQSARYTRGLPLSLSVWRRPLPFSYESAGIETHFTQGLDPEPRARAVFAFHQPETLAVWLKSLPEKPAGSCLESSAAVPTGSAKPAVFSDFSANSAINSVAACAGAVIVTTFF